jgi:hypothetical protein
VIARALPSGAGTFTPRVELARGPLADIPLPLSLALTSHRIEALLAWRTEGWIAEGGGRVDLWEAAQVPGRVQNPALEGIDANRVTTVYAYALTQRGGWFDGGLAAKAAWSSHNTLLATRVSPSWAYSWYPASAPPFAVETAVVLRAQGHPSSSLELTLQVQLPALSQETRQWESVRETSWGTAPWEARLRTSWLFLSATAVVLDAYLFAKPWERWDPLGAGAYRMASAQISLQQRF